MLGRNEELREHIVKFEDEDGDITERQGSEGERPRRTWAESVATPVEHPLCNEHKLNKKKEKLIENILFVQNKA